MAAHDSTTAYRKWATANYGDSGKTKTVTRNKYDKIHRILNGNELTTTENSKFRFWVRAKGFKLGPLSGLDSADGQNEEPVLYVPNKGADKKIYKRVAIVENFYDIIHGVHVDTDGRSGKHAGQKRTYKAIAATYAFLPREAVTRFLLSCAHCQRRLHHDAPSTKSAPKPEETAAAEALASMTSQTNMIGIRAEKMDFSLPITTSYMRSQRMNEQMREDSLSSAESDMESNDLSPSAPTSPKLADSRTDAIPVFPKTCPSDEKEPTLVIDMGKHSPGQNGESELPNFTENGRKRRASDEGSVESSTKTSDLVEDGSREDDDDDDDGDDDCKLSSKDYDPERLKAFNMFVRLFVDENLDRMVPISKQPKDKVQAILDACNRQFPEFTERSRKRIRTYLKSCRRLRRSKEQNGWEQMQRIIPGRPPSLFERPGLYEPPHKLRPTPPHLTSAAAEGLLAQACDNETQNAKRMRLGMEPLAASAMPAAPPPAPVVTSVPEPAPVTVKVERVESTPASLPVTLTTSEFVRAHAPVSFRPPPELPAPFFANGNAALFRPGFPTFPAHHHNAGMSPGLPTTPAPITQQNGPADLSVKKLPSALIKQPLTNAEITTIRSLITGYRESAAFLYRSADELEQLLLQHN